MSLRTAVLRMLRLLRPLREPERTPPPDTTHEDLDGKPRLLFWSPENPPQSFIRLDVPPGDRAKVVAALKAGQFPDYRYGGHADCRICVAALGSTDMLVCDMVYPEQAEHYLMVHNVWTPGCDELLRRLRARGS
ncbi:MAG: hypothetical protein ABJB39_11205 [Chloroflexota bacterium]